MSNARFAGLTVLVALTGWLLYLLAPVLTPFVAAALLAYVGNPLVGGLERLRLPRVLAVVLVFLLFAAVFFGLMVYLVPLLFGILSSFTERLPEYYDWAVAQSPRLEAWLGLELKFDLNALRQTLIGHWREIGNWITQALGVAADSGFTVVRWLVNLVLIPVVAFYLLLDWRRIGEGVVALVPPRYRTQARELAHETNEVLGSFLRGQLLVMLALATVYTTGLWLVGLDLALPIGLVAGAVSFVPYLGFVTGLISAGIATYLQFHDAFMLLWVLGVFVIGQGLDATLLTPRLVGRRIGLHPVVVIFALMAGGQLFGFFGVLIALPMAAALKVWLGFAHASWVRTPARARRR